MEGFFIQADLSKISYWIAGWNHAVRKKV